MKKRYKVLLALVILILLLSSRETFHRNKGQSTYTGSVSNGTIENAHLLPYSGKNFRYFSPTSYYLLDNGYAHSKVVQTIKDAYKICEKTCPNTKFRIMETANRKGGKMLIHKTHQTGFSADFMTPLRKNRKQKRAYDRIGLTRYLMNFDSSGKANWDIKTEIDFEVMVKHILALDKAARANGLRIKKVIFKIELKDELFQTKSGKKLKSAGIYFARSLPKMVNAAHDDHYHVDFELI